MESMPHTQPLDDELLEQIREDDRIDMLQRVRAFEIADSMEHDGTYP